MKAVVPLLLFQLFKTFDHTLSFSKLMYGGFFVLFFLAIAAGCINIRSFMRYATIVCVMASVLLAVQYFCYYILGFHLQLAPTSLFLNSSSGWALGARTGLYGVRGLRTGFYRPSAFFMEPSHLFLYSFPVLCALLFSPNMTRWRMQSAIWISVGLFLSTSGMGVLTATGLWAVFLAFYYSENREANVARVKRMFSAKRLALLIGIAIVLVVLYYTVPSFSKTVGRFLVDSSTGRSKAIDGRTRLASNLVKTMSGMKLIIGVTDNLNNIDFNMSGYYATLYKYGIVGIVLSYWYYAQYLFRVKAAGFWICATVLVVSFFSAHTHGTFYMLYYVMVLMNALYMSKTASIAVSEPEVDRMIITVPVR